MESIAMERSRFLPKHFYIVLIAFIILLVVSVIASFVFGSRTLSISEVMGGLLLQTNGSYEASIVQKRILRTVFSLCCGAALGISGVLMQAVTRNPIADPSILGVNTGAALSVVCGMAFFNISTAYHYIWFALAGALIVAILVFGIGSMGRGGATPLKLILAGAATSAALSSLITAIMIPRSFVMNQFRFWQVGSVGAGTWDSVLLIAPFLCIGVVVALITAPALNALALGEEAATGLGVKTGVIKLIAAFAGVILCGATTAVAGPIAFVGLLATHIIRLLIGA